SCRSPERCDSPDPLADPPHDGDSHRVAEGLVSSRIARWLAAVRDQRVIVREALQALTFARRQAAHRRFGYVRSRRSAARRADVGGVVRPLELSSALAAPHIERNSRWPRTRSEVRRVRPREAPVLRVRNLRLVEAGNEVTRAR